MRLSHGMHLAYCTNIHRGESWGETFAGLEQYTLAVRQRVCPDRPYGIGLRLSDRASRELAEPGTRTQFERWLRNHNCYIFTINGFPFGLFHASRVKETVYRPDWTTHERLEYTRRLFNLLVDLLPDGIEGSVSTVPVSFKGFKLDARAEQRARDNLWRCVEHLEQLRRQSGKSLHLGLEPEPLCYLENTQETVSFFDRMRADRPGDLRLDDHLGVNYDCCHLAIEYEKAPDALERLRRARIKISKIHISNALKVTPTAQAREGLCEFADKVYFHQVIEQRPDGELVRYGDLEEALATPLTDGPQSDREWRIHFHIPLHAKPTATWSTTSDHVLAALDVLQRKPTLCQHLEMETYTWEVMPVELRRRSVVDQLVDEYAWTLKELAARRFVPENRG